MTLRPRLALASLVAALLAAGAAAQAPPRLEVALDPASCTIGDPVEATLTLRLEGDDRSLPVRFPAWGAQWGDLAVLEAGAVEKIESGGAVVHRQRLRVAAYRVGEVVAPPVTVELGTGDLRAVSAPAQLEIRSVLPAGEADPAPRPPAPPRRLPLPLAFWLVAALLTAAAVAVARALRRRPGAAAATPALPPLEELERALDRLAGYDPAPGHAGLSLALRRYLGRSCGVPAPAWSTTELARRLDRREIEAGVVQRTLRLLRDIDQIKFARQPAEPAALERRIAEARELARAIEARLHPPAPAAGAPGAPGSPAARGSEAAA